MLLFPLAGFVLLVAFGRRIGDPRGRLDRHGRRRRRLRRRLRRPRRAARPARNHRVVIDNYFTWFSSGGLTVPVGTLVDPLSMTMCMFVTGVSALHPPLLHRLHEGRSRLLQVLHLPEPLRLLHAPAGAGGQPGAHLRRVGGRRRLLLLAGRLLVPARVGRLGRQEGLHLQPHRRRRLPARHLPASSRRPAPSSTRAGRAAASSASSRTSAAARAGRGAAPVPGRHRQVGPDPAVQLAARRHGGPDPGLGAHPRRHHGHGGRLPAVSHEPAAAPDGNRVPRSSRPSAPSPPSWPPPSPARSRTSRRCWPSRPCRRSAT